MARVEVSKERIEAGRAEIRLEMIKSDIAPLYKGKRKERVDALVARDIGCVPHCSGDAEHFWRLAARKAREAVELCRKGSRTKSARWGIDRKLADAFIYMKVVELRIAELRAR